MIRVSRTRRILNATRALINQWWIPTAFVAALVLVCTVGVLLSWNSPLPF